MQENDTPRSTKKAQAGHKPQNSEPESTADGKPLEVAHTFALALDQDRFDNAAAVVAPDCIYFIGGTALSGRDQVVDSYRRNAEKALKLFDHIEYGSEVAARDDGTVAVIFTDRIEHAGRQHTYQCCQVLTVANGMIARIIHEELPGKREALDQFLAECDIKPR